MKKRNIEKAFSLAMGCLCILVFARGDLLAQEVKVKKILSIEAYDQLNTVPDTYLIDVRTRAEYQFVGHPNNAYLFPYMFLTNKVIKSDEKYEYQFNQKNKDFIEEISKVFKKTDNLLIICRDGIRSALAAKELIDNGFKKVTVITDGFEGPEFPSFDNPDLHKFYRLKAKLNKLDSYLHRRHYGWQYWGLPWTYEMDPKYLYPPDLKTVTE
jgi:rhodanese-related sulfurtransferase